MHTSPIVALGSADDNPSTSRRPAGIFATPPRAAEGRAPRAHADSHPEPDAADRDHRVLSAAAVVRPQPERAFVQVGARRIGVPRTVPRCGRGDHQRAGGGGSRHRHRRRQPVRSRGRGQIVVLLSDRAHHRRRGPSRHLARLDEPARAASGQDPVGGAGGVSARRGEAQARARTAGIHRDLAGGAAHDRSAGEVRCDLRAGAGQHAVERVLRRTTSSLCWTSATS